MEKKKKYCQVCGDAAHGFNFNALSCESCKAFFRRNAFKTIRGRCDGHCEVTVESRSFCKKCRLRKCFSSGMQRDLILNEQEKLQRKEIIQMNHLKRNKIRPKSKELIKSNEDINHDCTIANLRIAKNLPKHPCSDQQNRSIKSNQSVIESLNICNIDSEVICRYLPKPQHHLAIEICIAFGHAFPKDDRHCELGAVCLAPSPVEILNMCAHFTQRMVTLANRLSSFKALPLDDQAWLLKGCILELLVLRSAILFSETNLEWLSLKEDGLCRISAANLQFGSRPQSNFFDSYKHFALRVRRCIRDDMFILRCLFVLSVFSADRPRVGADCKQAVADTQQAYAELLQAYVFRRYRGCDGMFASIMVLMADLRDLNEEHSNLVFNMDSKKLTPLTLEIFNVGRECV